MPAFVVEKKLTPGQEVVLQDTRLSLAEEANVTVEILSNDKAKVLVKTSDGCFVP